MATGMIADGVEGIYVLDHVTGDLQCWVINMHGYGSGAFSGRFKTNVMRDLNVDASKAPKFAMVTGSVAFRGGTSGALNPAGSVVYVSDTSTGNIVAYSVMWDSARASSGGAQDPRNTSLRLVGAGEGRTAAIRPGGAAPQK
jgi:hypothetical protein